MSISIQTTTIQHAKTATVQHRETTAGQHPEPPLGQLPEFAEGSSLITTARESHKGTSKNLPSSGMMLANRS